MSRATPLLLSALLLAGALSFAPPAAATHAAQHVAIVSFDGTLIQATVFTPEGASADAPVPFVLMTHGWGGKRIAEPTGRVLDLLDAGYGVLTWDSRGFGASGGEVQLNDPDFEGRDVSILIDHLSSSVPAALHDAPGDPRVGMSGGSYAGGIQLLAAAFDARIDVIAPEVTWNDLNEALGPNGVPKLYWTSLLFASGLESSCVNARNSDPPGAIRGALVPAETASHGCQTSDLARWYAMVHATGTIPDEVRDALAKRSPASYMANIDIPTLLVQGYPDTLFDANQAIANYHGIKANGAPVKLWLYDGGHARPEMGGLVPNTQAALVTPLVIDWFDRHLKGDTDVDTGAEVEYFVDGAWHAASSFPLAADEGLDHARHVAGLPSLVQGPVVPGAQGSVGVPLMHGPALVTGTAQIRFDASGLGPEGIVFASLARQGPAGTTRLMDQTQPLRFALGAGLTTVETDLVAVAADLAVGESLVLTIASTDPLYDGPRAPGFVNIQNVDVQWQTTA